MILGIDVGNYATKSSQMINFISKCSTVGNMLGNKAIVRIGNKKYYIGEGSFDTEYQKSKKENYMEFLVAAIALSTKDVDNKIVTGLPLSQYKKDKDILKELILSNRINYVEINGEERQIIIEDCEVFAESIASITDIDFEGIVLDIGGRTTDVALIIVENGIKKVINLHSIPRGTLNLYSDFIKVINNKYSLDLKIEDTERILKNGLKIYGIQKDIKFAIEVFKEFVENLVKTIQVEYSIKTLNLITTGGGASLLYKPLKNRLPQLQLAKNAFYGNALGYKKVGEQKWNS